jgi:hypothetical protein
MLGTLQAQNAALPSTLFTLSADTVDGNLENTECGAASTFLCRFKTSIVNDTVTQFQGSLTIATRGRNTVGVAGS